MEETDAVPPLRLAGESLRAIPRLHQERHVSYLIVGFAATALSLVALVLAPARGILLVAVATIVEAVGAALLAPYLEGFITAAGDPHRRARVLGVANTFVLLVASPSGWTAVSSPSGIGGFRSSLPALCW